MELIFLIKNHLIFLILFCLCNNHPFYYCALFSSNDNDDYRNFTSFSLYETCLPPAFLKIRIDLSTPKYERTEEVKWNDNWALNCNFVGNDLTTIKCGGEQCGQFCDRHPTCTHWSWFQRDNGTCLLKKGSVSKRDAVYDPNEIDSCGFSSFYMKRYICGEEHDNIMKQNETFELCDLSQLKWLKGNLGYGCDFPGVDNTISTMLTNTGRCLKSCDANINCTHYTYLEGLCTLKSGAISKKNAVITNDLFMICGLTSHVLKWKICQLNDSSIGENDALNASEHATMCVFTHAKLIWFDNWAYYCEFTSVETTLFTMQMADGHNCGPLCNSIPGCSHYMWKPNVGGGTCYIKNGPVRKEDARKSEYISAICGLANLHLNPETCRMENGLFKRSDSLMNYDTDEVCGSIEVFFKPEKLRYLESSKTCYAQFPGEKFQVGIEYEQMNMVNISNYDYITIWLNKVDFTYNYISNHNKKMLNQCKLNNKMAIFYAYIIAFEARAKHKLLDCNMDEEGYDLCSHGSCFILEYRDHLVNVYKQYALEISNVLGRYSTSIFAMEPDFWQYYGDSRQHCKLNGTFMRDLFKDFVKAIKFYLPNALISWDISSWLRPDEFCEWWRYFESCTECEIKFIHTSGGESRPNMQRFKPNELTWKFVSELTGKKIIADCGYEVAGNLNDNCNKWENEDNLSARIHDGVVALSVAYPTTESGYKKLALKK